MTVGSSTFQTTGFQTGTAALGYQGYTVASGRILTKITEGTYSGQWPAICVVMCRDMSHPVYVWHVYMHSVTSVEIS